MSKTKVYEPEFKKKIVRLYLEEGRTIKSLNEEYQLGMELSVNGCGHSAKNAKQTLN